MRNTRQPVALDPGTRHHRSLSQFRIRMALSVLILSIAASDRVAAEVIAEWQFQKGTAGDAATPAQLIEDSSGNDRHGRALGGPQYRVVPLSQSNLGLRFDGVDDRIVVRDDPCFHLTRSLTLEAYIEIDFYPGSDSGAGHIVFRGDDRLGFDPWFLAVTESGQLQFLVADLLNNASVVLSPDPLPTGELLHVAATLDDETGRQSLFINGQRVASTETTIRSGGALGGLNPAIGIANRNSHSNQGFRGTLAAVRISDEALSPEQFLPSESLRQSGNAER